MCWDAALEFLHSNLSQRTLALVLGPTCMAACLQRRWWWWWWWGVWGFHRPELGLAGEGGACEPEAARLPGKLPAGRVSLSPAMLFLSLLYQYCFAVRDTGERAINPPIAEQGHLGHRELRKGVIA